MTCRPSASLQDTNQELAQIIMCSTSGELPTGPVATPDQTTTWSKLHARSKTPIWITSFAVMPCVCVERSVVSVLLRSGMPCSNTMLSTDNLYRCRDAANHMQQDLSNDGIASLRASCKDWKCVIDGAVHTATPSQLRLQQLQHMYVEAAHLHRCCTRDGEVTQRAFLQVP